MRIRKLRVAAALSVVSFLAGWAALSPPADPPVPSRTVPDPRECVSTDTLSSAVDVFGDPPRNEQIVAYVGGDLPAGDLAGVIRSEAAAIAVLRQAADCRDPGRMDTGRTLDVWRIAQLGIVEARGRTAAEPEAALDELLDVWSVGLDLGRSGALVEVHVGAAMAKAAAAGILDVLDAEEIDASALSAARARVAGFRQRPADLDAALARDTRAYWAYLTDDPREIVGYARWKWRQPGRESAMVELGEADAQLEVVAAALQQALEHPRSPWLEGR